MDNSSINLTSTLLLYQENCLLPADAIILHLACITLLVVVVCCLLETFASFHLAGIFHDVDCKAVISVCRTSRALSIWLTFVLSAYWCLASVSHYLGFMFLFLWLLNTCMSSAAVLFSFSTQNDSSLVNHAISAQFCYVHFLSKPSKEANRVGREMVPMILMTLASPIILVFLYKHSQQVRGLHSRSSSGGSSGVVVALVTLSGVDNGLWVYTVTVRKTIRSSLISDLHIFFSSLSAALSPVVITASSRKVNGRLKCAAQERPVKEKAAVC